MSTISNNLSDESQMSIKRESSEDNNSYSYSSSHHSAFHAMAPDQRVDHSRHPDLPVFPPNSSAARVNPAHHAHSYASGFRLGETANFEHQSTSHSSGYQTSETASPDYKVDSTSCEYQAQYGVSSEYQPQHGVSSEYQPVSPTEYHEHQESSAQQEQHETQPKIESEFLRVMMNHTLKNTVPNAVISSTKRKAGARYVLPSAKRLARYHSTPRQSQSAEPAGFMTPGTSQTPTLAAEIGRRPIARASRPSGSAAFEARQKRALAQPGRVVKVEEDTEMQTPSQSENSYNHDREWRGEQAPELRMAVSAVVEDSQPQLLWASSENMHRAQGHVESARVDISPKKLLLDFSPARAHNRRNEIPRPVKTEEIMSEKSHSPMPRAAPRVSEGVESATLAAYGWENSAGEIAELREGMKQMRSAMNHMGRENGRMMRRAARRGMKVDELSEEVAGLHEQVVAYLGTIQHEGAELAAWRNEAAAREKVIASLKDEVTGLKRQASGYTNGIAGLKGEIQELRSQASDYKADVASLKEEVSRMSHEMIRLERDALKKEVEGLRRRFL